MLLLVHVRGPPWSCEGCEMDTFSIAWLVQRNEDDQQDKMRITCRKGRKGTSWGRSLWLWPPVEGRPSTQQYGPFWLCPNVHSGHLTIINEWKLPVRRGPPFLNPCLSGDQLQTGPSPKQIYCWSPQQRSFSDLEHCTSFVYIDRKWKETRTNGFKPWPGRQFGPILISLELLRAI